MCKMYFKFYAQENDNGKRLIYGYLMGSNNKIC
jgi:hypothetical protein